MPDPFSALLPASAMSTLAYSVLDQAEDLQESGAVEINDDAKPCQFDMLNQDCVLLERREGSRSVCWLRRGNVHLFTAV